MAREDRETAEQPLTRGSGAAQEDAAAADRVRVRAAMLAAVVGTILLGLKYSAYQLTGSTAILSDALESIINVAAALFALGGLAAAGWPSDRSQARHAKADFFGAAFEGGMIALAAVLIIKEAGEAFIFGHQVRQIDYGLLITIGAGLANAALGWHLLQIGQRTGARSPIAGGSRVLADFWTSVATAVGLGLVRATGFDWLDAVVAAMVGVNLLWSGLRQVHHAAVGLLGEDDSGLLEQLLQALNTHRVPGVIRIHSLRTVVAGGHPQVEAQLVVPEFWTVEEAHEFATALQHRVRNSVATEVGISLQIRPCHRQFCASCEVEPCPIRVQPFAGRGWITLEDAMQPAPLGQ